MSPAQLGQVCTHFGLGPLKEAATEDDPFANYEESPIAKHCPHGCKNLKAYTCKDDDQTYVAFLNDRAIGILNPGDLHPDPCDALLSPKCRKLNYDECATGPGPQYDEACRSHVAKQQMQCVDSPKYTACLNKKVKQDEQRAFARVPQFRRIYGTPKVVTQRGAVVYLWHDTHTQISINEYGLDVEIDDLDASTELMPSPEKLYGLIVVRPIVGFASLGEASQSGRHLSVVEKEVVALLGELETPGARAR